MSDNWGPRIEGVWQKATILGATPVVVAMVGAHLPCTVTLKSSDTTRKIEISTDGGTEYFTANYDYVSTTQLTVAVTSPISHIRLTGVANDTWRIQ